MWRIDGSACENGECSSAVRDNKANVVSESSDGVSGRQAGLQLIQ